MEELCLLPLFGSWKKKSLQATVCLTFSYTPQCSASALWMTSFHLFRLIGLISTFIRGWNFVIPVISTTDVSSSFAWRWFFFLIWQTVYLALAPYCHRPFFVATDSVMMWNETANFFFTLKNISYLCNHSLSHLFNVSISTLLPPLSRPFSFELYWFPCP